MPKILENAIKITLEPGQLAWVKRRINTKKHHTGETRVTISSYFQALIAREQLQRERSQEAATKLSSSSSSEDAFHAFQPSRPLP